MCVVLASQTLGSGSLGDECHTGSGGQTQVGSRSLALYGWWGGKVCKTKERGLEITAEWRVYKTTENAVDVTQKEDKKVSRYGQHVSGW